MPTSERAERDWPARRRRILKLALPIMGGMMSQTILNLVDTAMVGTLGTAPLAAVGLASFVNVLCAAFVMGMAAGVQATAAQFVGAGRQDEAAVPLNGGLLLALAFALPASLFFVYTAPGFFPILAGGEAVAEAGVPYLQARLVGIAAIGMNMAFRGYWNAVERSVLYLRTIVVIHIANVILNWILIFGNLGVPALGTLGAGIASTASLFLGTACYFYLGMRHARASGFLHALPNRQALANLLRVSAPAGLQQVLFFVGMTAFFTMLAQMDSAALAGGTVLTNLMLAWILPANAFGLTAASLAGQAVGAKDPDDANDWTWQVARIAMSTVAILALPALILPDPILGIFLYEAPAIELARGPLQLLAAFIAIDALGGVLLNAHLGVGASKRVLVVSGGTQWLVLIPAVYVVGPMLGGSLFMVYCVFAIYRMLIAAVFVWSWQRRDWVESTNQMGVGA